MRQGGTVLTPTARLARAIRADFENTALHSGVVEASPKILTIDAWMRECWMESAWNESAENAALLNAAQELELWEQVILESEEADRLLQVRSAAVLASEAWRLLHAWQLPWTSAAMEQQEDTAAFYRWSRRFAQICEKKHWVDRSRLPDALPPAATEVALAGFLRLTPQQRTVLDRVAPGWHAVQAFKPADGVAGTAGFATVEAEIRGAALWASAVLHADPDAKVAIACTDLTGKRRLLDRIFLEVFHPDQACFASTAENRVYSISSGMPLANHPMIHTALLALQLAKGELTLADAGSLLRSPFLGRGMQERAARAVLDASLRQNHPTYLNINEIAAAAKLKAPVMANLLAKFDKVRRGLPKAALPSSWASHLSRLLRTLDWPGTDALSPGEARVVELWHDVLSEYASLDAVTAQEPLSAAVQAIAELARMRSLASNEDGQVAILSLEDALGVPFDHLWVLGCTADAWPSPPHPNPFLPVVLQRAKGVTSSSAEGELKFAAAAMQLLVESAENVVFSFAQRDGERELRESALIAGLHSMHVEEVAASAPTAKAPIEEIEDAQAPPIPPDTRQRGGTRILQMQAACPFRAYAELRLGARGMESGEAGLNPRDRGKLLHEALRLVWNQLQTSARLQQSTGAELDELVRGAIRQSQWQPRDAFEREVLKLEAARLHELVLEWLESEKKRSPFVVAGQEHGRMVEFGKLKFNARVDRVDRFPDGSEAILDYKTGQVAANPWDGDRPDEPQLPAYAVSHPARVSGLAFALVSKGEMRLSGILDAARLPLDEWRRVLTDLANDFADGAAAVDPKNFPGTCEYCGAASICRVTDGQ